MYEKSSQIQINHSNLRTFIRAGEEGFEPSAYGFGDRRSTS